MEEGDELKPGDCMQYITHYACGCKGEWDWECHHDDDIPHELQFTYWDEGPSEYTCGRPNCDGKGTAESGNESPCVKLVIIFTCGHEDDENYDCDHAEGIEHDPNPRLEKVISEEKCQPNCPGKRTRKPDAGDVVGGDGGEGTSKMPEMLGKSKCLAYVTIFTCGCEGEKEYRCSHKKGMKHDREPNIKKVHSQMTCGARDCPGQQVTESEETEEVGDDG